MSNPVDLESLLLSLSSALVAARQYLDEEAQGEAEARAAVESVTRLPLPRFAIDEITFEVPYVVEDVVTRKEQPPDIEVARPIMLTDRELVSLTKNADDALAKKLNVLVRDHMITFERLAIAAERGETPPPLEPIIQLTESELDVLKEGASAASVAKLDRVLEQYAANYRSLRLVRKELLRGPVPRLMVRVDPEAVDKASQSARHVVKVTFRGDEIDTHTLREENLPEG